MSTSTQSRLYTKHLYFIAKGLDWDNISDGRKYDYVFKYVMNPKHPDNKRQDLARMIHSFNNKNYQPLNHSELLELAIGVTVN